MKMPVSEPRPWRAEQARDARNRKLQTAYATLLTFIGIGLVVPFPGIPSHPIGGTVLAVGSLLIIPRVWYGQGSQTNVGAARPWGWLLFGAVLLLISGAAFVPFASRPDEQQPLLTQRGQSPSPAAAGEVADPAVIYADRLRTYWLPQVEALSVGMDDAPGAESEIFVTFEEMARNLSDGERLSLSREQQQLRRQLFDTLVRKQRNLFPILRRRMANMLRESMFRMDIDVVARGQGSRTVRLTGSPFIRNAEIADAHNGLSYPLRRARFTKAEYRWSPRLNEGYDYTLDAPSDGAIGHWDIGRRMFIEVRP